MRTIDLLSVFCAFATSSIAAATPKPLAAGDFHRASSQDKVENTASPCSSALSTPGGSATNYCQATLNSTGTAASMGQVGSLTLAGQSFGLLVTGAAALPNSLGRFIYGTQAFNTTYGNGYLCISPFTSGCHTMPVQRLGTGTVVLTMTQHPSDFAPFTPASTWNFQFLYRDLPAGGAGFNSSDGLHVVFAP